MSIFTSRNKKQVHVEGHPARDKEFLSSSLSDLQSKLWGLEEEGEDFLGDSRKEVLSL